MHVHADILYHTVTLQKKMPKHWKPGNPGEDMIERPSWFFIVAISCYRIYPSLGLQAQPSHLAWTPVMCITTW